MDDENNTDNRTDESENNSPSNVPIPTAVPKSQTLEEGTEIPNSCIKTFKELARKFKWFKVISLAIGIFVLCVYYRQLKVMNGQLEQMKGGSGQTERLIDETHTLAQNAGTQATNTKKLAGSASEEVQKLGAMVTAANKQAAALGDQLSIMQRQLESADRPWIDVKVSLTTPLTHDDSGYHVGVRHTYRNVGKSPAQNIWLSTKLLASVLLMGVPEGRATPKEIQKQLCDPSRREQDLTGYIVLFPDDSYAQEEILNLPGQDSNSLRGLQNSPIKASGVVPLGLVGCVDYTFEASPTHHQTGFGFVVLNDRGLAPMVGQPLTLSRVPIDGFYFAN